MDKSELAKLMLQWETVKSRLDEIEQAIKDSVLQIGETVTAGNVKASYNKGRKSYEYNLIGKDAPRELVEEYTKVTTNVNWRSLVIEGLGIPQDEVPYRQSEPSVTVKII